MAVKPKFMGLGLWSWNDYRIQWPWNGLNHTGEHQDCDFEDFDFTRTDVIDFRFEREKQNGTTTVTNIVITDPICIDMLKLYVACFPPDKRKGRFLRHLKRRNGQLEYTEQKFGRHAAQEFPKIIAQALLV